MPKKTTTTTNNKNSSKNTVKKSSSQKSTKKVNNRNTKSSKKGVIKNNGYTKREKANKLVMIFILFFFGILLIFSTYAWLSTALNVKVRNFTMKVARNSGLSISLDGINFDSFVEISQDILIDKLQETYPNNLSQWAGSGLIPVSSPGIRNSNMPTFDVYASGGVRYKTRKKENGFVYTQLSEETFRTEFNKYIAFDVFLKNQTGSPVSDNLYLDARTYMDMIIDGVNSDEYDELFSYLFTDEEGNKKVVTQNDDVIITDDGEVIVTEKAQEMLGLVNSLRLGIVRIGTVPIKSSVQEIQNMSCNNKCQAVIYEPHSKRHTELAIERAKKFDVYLEDGKEFPTFAFKKAGGPVYIKNAVSGSPFLDPAYFTYQETIKDEDLDTPIFELPDGITKLRIYLWIEGQDIDSLETNSHGAQLVVSIDFSKDTEGWQAFN